MKKQILFVGMLTTAATTFSMTSSSNDSKDSYQKEIENRLIRKKGKVILQERSQTIRSDGHKYTDPQFLLPIEKAYYEQLKEVEVLDPKLTPYEGYVKPPLLGLKDLLEQQSSSFTEFLVDIQGATLGYGNNSHLAYFKRRQDSFSRHVAKKLPGKKTLISDFYGEQPLIYDPQLEMPSLSLMCGFPVGTTKQPGLEYAGTRYPLSVPIKNPTSDPGIERVEGVRQALYVKHLEADNQSLTNEKYASKKKLKKQKRVITFLSISTAALTAATATLTYYLKFTSKK